MAKTKPAPRRNRGGPYLVAAVLCQDVEKLPGGLTINGVRTLALLGKPGDEIDVQIAVVVAPGDYRGELRGSFSIIFPGGNTETGYQREEVFGEGSSQLKMWRAKINLSTALDGLYWIAVRVNGREVTRIPLEVSFRSLLDRPEGLPV